jgi:DNA-binding FadR family transcriptional regulator
VPLQSVEPLRLYRQIAGQIAALVESGEFAVGSRLPAERELASLLGVSRTSVREAIISLEIAGLVEVRVGSGIFVRAPRRDPAAPRDSVAGDDGPGPFDLLAARRVIEGEIAALAATKAAGADIAGLRETIVRMRERADVAAERDAADRDFHVRIAQATGNSAFAPVVAGMWNQRGGDLWAKIEEHFHTARLRSKTLTDHEAIVAALEAHDPNAAREAMHRHLARVAREFQRRWDGGPGARKPRSPTAPPRTPAPRHPA